jgi:hypothetical protein
MSPSSTLRSFFTSVRKTRVKDKSQEDHVPTQACTGLPSNASVLPPNKLHPISPSSESAAEHHSQYAQHITAVPSSGVNVRDSDTEEESVTRVVREFECF